MLCVNCGKETTNPKFCSQSCAACYNNKLHPKRKKTSARNRLCKVCKQPFYATRPNSSYCSYNCIYQERINSIEQTGYFNNSWNNNKSIRNYLIDKHGNYCMICGQSGDNWCDKPITLIVDHIDGDSKNWAVSNIRIVCPNCDSQLPTFKGRNKGKSTRKYTISQK